MMCQGIQEISISSCVLFIFLYFVQESVPESNQAPFRSSPIQGALTQARRSDSEERKMSSVSAPLGDQTLARIPSLFEPYLSLGRQPLLCVYYRMFVPET